MCVRLDTGVSNDRLLMVEKNSKKLPYGYFGLIDQQVYKKKLMIFY